MPHRLSYPRSFRFWIPKIRQPRGNASTSPFSPPTGQYGTLPFASVSNPTTTPIVIDVSQVGAQPDGATALVSMEVNDARNGGNSSAWTRDPDLSSLITGDSGSSLDQGNTMGRFNSAATKAGAIGDGLTGTDSKYRFFDYGHQYYNSVDSRPSIGLLSIVPLGMQRNIPYDTLKFTPHTDATNLPDWLLLDLIAPSIRPYSYMNSAMGKGQFECTNLGRRNQLANSVSDASVPARWRPLQAVFQNMESSTTTASKTEPAQTVKNILTHNLASGVVANSAEAAGIYDTWASFAISKESLIIRRSKQELILPASGPMKD